MRSTTEVLDHHRKCFAARDLDGLLADYAADAVFFGPEGAFRGPDAIKPVFGYATLVHGRREEVCLEEVPAERRAPVLKVYWRSAPGARAHLPVQKDAVLADFEQIAPQIPVFRVIAESARSSMEASRPQRQRTP